MACPYSEYCIGMCEFTECPGALQLESAKPHLPTSTGTRVRVENGPASSPSVTAGQPSRSVSTTERFEYASEQELTELVKDLESDYKN